MAEDRRLSIHIGREAPLVFDSPDAAESWLKQEMDAWYWLRNERVRAVSGYVGGIQQDFPNLQDAAMAEIRQWKSNPEHRSRVEERLTQIYRQQRYPLSTEPIYQVARRLLDEDMYESAASALAAHVNKLSFRNGEAPLAVLRGAIEAAMLEAGIGPKTPADVKRSLKNVADQLSTRLAEAESELVARKVAFDEQLRAGEERLAAIEMEVRAEWEGKIRASIESIEATEAAYKEKMRLRSSVNYWDDQAKNYARARARALKVLIAAAGAVAICVVVAAYFVVPLVVDPTASPNVLVVSTALTLLLATIIFWAGRVLVRLFLSAHHLKIDAEERIAMVQTFLALVDEQAIDPNERVLILTPLFRPAADGIVKDEGAPDASISAIVARMLAKQ